MNINFFSQIFLGHHRAFNVPSRTSLTPWRYPERFPFFFRFPENEIQRVFLLVLSRHLQRPEPRLQVFQIFMRQFSIFLEIFYPEIYRSIDFISKAFVHQSLNHINHALDFLGCQRMGGGFLHIHVCHVFFAFFNITGRNFFCAYPFLHCFCNNFIIYVSKV